MFRTYRKRIVRTIVMLLILAVMVPTGAMAAIGETAQPYASDYLNSYNAYLYMMGSGRVRTYFNVTGTGYMDELGALTIRIYESRDNSSWYWVKSYAHNNYSNMLAYDDYFHAGNVDFQGTAGRYYKAYVCIWAGKNGAGDTRYFWTSVQQATR